MKTAERLRLLSRAVPPTPGRYACTVPGCRTKTDKDGFCPTHHVPLRLVKHKG